MLSNVMGLTDLPSEVDTVDIVPSTRHNWPIRTIWRE